MLLNGVGWEPDRAQPARQNVLTGEWLRAATEYACSLR